VNPDLIANYKVIDCEGKSLGDAPMESGKASVNSAKENKRINVCE
jgi:hypothetical protein